LTTINDGILTIQTPLGLGTAAGGTLVNKTLTKTGTLQLDDPNTATDGGGFTILDEQVTLNGPGVGSLGALANVRGNNTWAANIVLGSPNPNGSNVSMGVAAGGSLTVSGVISDVAGAGPFDLTKVDAGKLILNNANTYRGQTNIQTGIVNIRDSQALGATSS